MEETVTPVASAEAVAPVEARALSRAPGGAARCEAGGPSGAERHHLAEEEDRVAREGFAGNDSGGVGTGSEDEDDDDDTSDVDEEVDKDRCAQPPCTLPCLSANHILENCHWAAGMAPLTHLGFLSLLRRTAARCQ